MYSHFLYFFAVFYNLLFLVHFLSSVFSLSPSSRGCSNSVSPSLGLFTAPGVALFQPLLKPLASASFPFVCMTFIKGVIRSQVGIYLISADGSIRNGQRRTTNQQGPKQFQPLLMKFPLINQLNGLSLHFKSLNIFPSCGTLLTCKGNEIAHYIILINSHQALNFRY